MSFITHIIRHISSEVDDKKNKDLTDNFYWQSVSFIEKILFTSFTKNFKY